MKSDLIEATVNTVLGLCLGWAILRIAGMPGGTALVVQGAFIAVSFARSFLVRRVFRSLG